MRRHPPEGWAYVKVEAGDLLLERAIVEAVVGEEEVDPRHLLQRIIQADARRSEAPPRLESNASASTSACPRASG